MTSLKFQKATKEDLFLNIYITSEEETNNNNLAICFIHLKKMIFSRVSKWKITKERDWGNAALEEQNAFSDTSRLNLAWNS